MSWVRIIPAVFRPTKELFEVFRVDTAAQAGHGSAERPALSADGLAALQQLATGCQPRGERTRWDAFIDGLNRVPRPLITLGVLAFFVLAPLDPARFAQIARAYELMPDGFWALLSVIVAFYFGGRMQLKRQDIAIRGGALEVAREVLAMQRTARVRNEAPPAPLPQAGLRLEPDVRANRVIEAWQRQRAALTARR